MNATLIEMLRAVVSRHSGVLLAILFGSAARDTSRADSDVDLAVLAPGVDLMALAAELMQAIARDVDVVSLDDPTIPLLEEVLRDGIIVYESSPGRAAAFRARVLIDLETDRPWFRRMSDAWLRRVAERGFTDGES